MRVWYEVGGLNVLDLGTGSGNLLLSILSELPIDADARGVGVDISPAAGTSAVLYKFALYIRSSARCCFLCYLTDSLIYSLIYMHIHLHTHIHYTYE